MEPLYAEVAFDASFLFDSNNHLTLHCRRPQLPIQLAHTVQLETMPHSVSPESSLAPDETMITQVGAVPMEDQEIGDAEMKDAEDTPPSSTSVKGDDAVSQEKSQLEAMFEDDDEDFPSSNEAVTLYVIHHSELPQDTDESRANRPIQRRMQTRKS